MNATTKNLSSVWTHSTSFVAASGQGVRITTTDGHRLLDFTSGIGVNSTGHCHPKVVDAIKKQAEKLIFSQINVVWNDRLLELGEKFVSIVPKGLDRCFFSGSGAEAIEAAVKLAKHATGKSNVIVMQGSFHGRTHLAMAMTTSKTGYRLNYAPLPAGIHVAPYPYALALGMTEEDASRFALEQLDLVLHTQTAPSETAAIVVEPILGEGGYVVPPAGYLTGLRRICDENGILLVVDEIQSGFCRSGKWFAHQYEEGLVPDIMTVAKGLGSGFPISGIAYRSELEAKWVPGSHGGTYGGGPLACAAAIATIGVMQEDALAENARERGDQLISGLKSLQSKFPIIGQVRGRGLMVGVELLRDGAPAPDVAGPLLKEVYDRDMLLLSCGIRKNVIRWIPPLISTASDIDEGLSKFSDALAAVSGRPS
jgi:4-aminobutyrate aminotransferase